MGLSIGVANYVGRVFARWGVGWATSLVCGVVLGFGRICLGRGMVDELAIEGVIGLTTLLDGSGFLALGCIFLGKGDMGA